MDPNGSWKRHSLFSGVDTNFVHTLFITFKPERVNKAVGMCQTRCFLTIFPLPSQHLPYLELWERYLESQGWMQWPRDPGAPFCRTGHPQHFRWRKDKYWLGLWKFKSYLCPCHWISESCGSNSSISSFIRCQVPLYSPKVPLLWNSVISSLKTVAPKLLSDHIKKYFIWETIFNVVYM